MGSLFSKMRRERTNAAIKVASQTLSSSGVYKPPVGKVKITIEGRGASGTPPTGGNVATTNPPTSGNYAGTNPSSGGNYAGTNPGSGGNVSTVNPRVPGNLTGYGAPVQYVYVTQTETYNTPGPGTPYTHYYGPFQYFIVSPYSSNHLDSSYGQNVYNVTNVNYGMGPGDATYNPATGGNSNYNPYVPGNDYYNAVQNGFAYYNPTVPGTSNYNATIPGVPGAPSTIAGVTFPGGLAGQPAPIVSETSVTGALQFSSVGADGYPISILPGGYVTIKET